MALPPPSSPPPPPLSPPPTTGVVLEPLTSYRRSRDIKALLQNARQHVFTASSAHSCPTSFPIILSANQKCQGYNHSFQRHPTNIQFEMKAYKKKKQPTSEVNIRCDDPLPSWRMTVILQTLTVHLFLYCSKTQETLLGASSEK